MYKQGKCGFRCKRNQICAIQEAYYSKFIMCILFGPKKLSEEVAAHEPTS